MIFVSLILVILAILGAPLFAISAIAVRPSGRASSQSTPAIDVHTKAWAGKAARRLVERKASR